MLPGNKKLLILYILDILKDFSDENHLLSQNDIMKKLYSIYGVECDRKSIGANIDSLIDFGYGIVKTRKGSFLAEREFEPSEVQFLVDAVFSSRCISSKHSIDLAKKLSSTLSNYQRKQYNYVYKSNELNRTSSKELFYNIDIINEAIEKDKQIQFNYKKTTFKNVNLKDKTYVVNPYYLINNQGKYFLVCNYDYFNEIGNYKVERIYNIKILDSPRKPINKLKEFENGFDIVKYANENIYMFSTKSIDALLKLSSDKSSIPVEEWFGKNATFFEKDSNLYAKINANETSLIYWCIQYGEDVELLEPKETREKIKNIVNIIKQKYE